jgi:hypothetical protein
MVEVLIAALLFLARHYIIVPVWTLIFENVDSNLVKL